MKCVLSNNNTPTERKEIELGETMSLSGQLKYAYYRESYFLLRSIEQLDSSFTNKHIDPLSSNALKHKYIHLIGPIQSQEVQ